MSRGLKIFLKVFLITFLVGALIVVAVIVSGCFGLFGLDSDFDVNALDLNYTSIVYYTDADGEPHELERLYKSQNRVWADITEIPKYMQDAFVSIEDERFYSHNGVDHPPYAESHSHVRFPRVKQLRRLNNYAAACQEHHRRQGCCDPTGKSVKCGVQ